MSRRLLVGVDVDGVLYHWERTARYMLRRKIGDEGRRIPEELYHPSTGWNMIEEVVGPEDWEWLWGEGVDKGLFRYGHVVGGSLEGITALNEIADLNIITTRPTQAVPDTLAWLSLFLDKVDLKGIHILSHGQPKWTVNPLPDLLIDDRPENVDDWSRNVNRPALLFDQPWNRGYRRDRHAGPMRGVIRANGWKDTVRLVRLLNSTQEDE